MNGGMLCRVEGRWLLVRTGEELKIDYYMLDMSICFLDEFV